MKAITEFSSFTLIKAIAAHKTLAEEGKTPEEIQENLGQTFKIEGEKLGYFIKAIEVAGTNTENLRRVLVARFAEGESLLPMAVQVEDIYYVPQFIVKSAPIQVAKPGQRSARPPQTRSNTGGPKGSQWGLSPEEKAAKSGKKPAAKT